MSVGRRVYIAQRVLEMRGTRHRWTVSGSSYSTEVHEEPINGTRKAAGGGRSRLRARLEPCATRLPSDGPVGCRVMSEDRRSAEEAAVVQAARRLRTRSARGVAATAVVVCLVTVVGAGAS